MRSRFRYVGWFIALFLVAACFVPTAVLASNKAIKVPYRVESNTISVTVTDGVVAYGTLALGTTKSTLELSPADTQTATNGDETANFNIKSSHATREGGVTWTLAATPDINAFTHKASIDAGVSWIAMTTVDTYVTLKTGVAAAGTQPFDLQIGMPTETTDYLEHTITVTILAVAP